MNTKSPLRTYYVRIAIENGTAFQEHLTMCEAKWDHMSYDAPGSSLYHIVMDEQSALSLKLSFPLLGCMDFNKTLGKFARPSAPCYNLENQ